MQNITIGRYPAASDIPADLGYKPHAGWIEGVRDDGSMWIMYLDGDGSPQTFFAVRTADGAVISDPVILDEPTFAEGGGTPVE